MRGSGVINRIRELPKPERKFFETKGGHIRYHETCLSCIRVCKQSFKVNSVSCPIRFSVHSPDDYLIMIKRKGYNLNNIGKEIGIDSRTVKSMLYERQDMSEELYIQLEKLLYGKVININELDELDEK